MTSGRLLQKTMFGIFVLFGVVALSTSALCVYTVDEQLSSQYEANGVAIAVTIANSSADILLNRDMSTVQSLIDQFKELEEIKYLYIATEDGEIIAHTFVPGIPEEISAADKTVLGTVDRRLPGFGEFMEVSSPILNGLAGSVHVGIDKGLLARKIQTAVGQQVYLISLLFIAGIVGSYLLLTIAARPLLRLADYGRQLAAPATATTISAPDEQGLLERRDEVGQLARIFKHLADAQTPTGPTQS